MPYLAFDFDDDELESHELDIKVLRRHKCSETHRKYSTAAKCIWPHVWHSFQGEGPYVVTEKFHDGRSYLFHHHLFGTRAEAEKFIKKHPQGQCCGSCLNGQIDLAFIAKTAVAARGNRVTGA